MAQVLLSNRIDLNIDNNFMTHQSNADNSIIYNYNYVSHIWDYTSSSMKHIINLYTNNSYNPARIMIAFTIQADALSIIIDRLQLLNIINSNLIYYTALNKISATPVIDQNYRCCPLKLDVMVPPTKSITIKDYTNIKQLVISLDIVEMYTV